MKKYFERLKNPATIIGISGYILTILSTLGISIDNDTVMDHYSKYLCYLCTAWSVE